MIAKQKADRGEAGGRSMAQAAFVLGIVSLVLHVVAVILGVALIALLIESIDDFDVPDKLVLGRNRNAIAVYAVGRSRGKYVLRRLR